MFKSLNHLKSKMNEIKRMNKKGILEDYQEILSVVIFVAIGALITSQIRTGLTTTAVENDSYIQVFDRGTNLSLNTSSQFATVGTILGVLLLVGAVAGLFVLFGRQ